MPSDRTPTRAVAPAHLLRGMVVDRDLAHESRYGLVSSPHLYEDTYAQVDLFDHLDTIDTLRKNGHTQKEIAEILSDGQEEWSESKVKQYSALLNNVVTDVLDTAREHQEGRVTDEVTDVTFEFTEWWFRNSGLYDLAPPDEDNDTEESDEDDEPNADIDDLRQRSKSG